MVGRISYSGVFMELVPFPAKGDEVFGFQEKEDEGSLFPRLLAFFWPFIALVQSLGLLYSSGYIS